MKQREVFHTAQISNSLISQKEHVKYNTFVYEEKESGDKNSKMKMYPFNEFNQDPFNENNNQNEFEKNSIHEEKDFVFS